MIGGPFLLALTAGMVASVNPCGFAMLPAYLSFFLGSEPGEKSTRAPVPRAIAVSIALTGGFITVFGILGFLWTRLSSTFQESLPFVTMTIGTVLVVMGIAMLRGWQMSVRLPKLERGGDSQELASVYLFGVSYAVASLSCTIPAFIAVSAVAVDENNWLSGVAIFAVYGIGMGLVIGVLTVAVALARDGVLLKLRWFMQHVGTISGVLLILAGSYVAYFGYDEWRVNNGELEERYLITKGAEIQTTVQQWITDIGAIPIAIGSIALLTGLVLWSRRRSASTPDEVPTPSDHEAEAVPR